MYLPGLAAAEHGANREAGKIGMVVRVQVGQEHLRRSATTSASAEDRCLSRPALASSMDALESRNTCRSKTGQLDTLGYLDNGILKGA